MPIVQDVVAEHPYAFKMLRQKWPPVFARDHNSPNVRLPLWRRVPRIGVDVEVRSDLIVEVCAINGLGPDPMQNEREPDQPGMGGTCPEKIG
ncbi:hypothetical protein O9K51_11448 [Purpureocillium lavendulum]|uniref:Uncharacterized protein n=1 Tax=Purpureocillium lavendulum TaxID=1247861 RepID=A0AB34FAD3_9HYPO|nr:hypothetical protein O9K51_11448 [Purpureocillium lavendulum]